MKCPKCSYISFDDAVRCRNCGYDFAFERAPEDAGVELPLRGSDVPEAAEDLPLAPLAAPASTPTPAGRAALHAPSRPSTADLPLFDAPVPGVDDTPLITAPAPPRQPLSVRRSAVEPPRSRPAERPPVTPPPAYQPVVPEPSRPSPGPSVHVPERERRRVVPEEPDLAPAPHAVVSDGSVAPVRRVVAALIDLVLVGAIDASVVWFTLKVLGLPLARATILPIAPMLLFFALLNGGYVVGFTAASGQTIGKMLTGVRVVGDATSRVPLGNAVVRAAATLLTIASLGIGYIPAFGTGERQTLHDRLAKTRVVRK